MLLKPLYLETNVLKSIQCIDSNVYQYQLFNLTKSIINNWTNAYIITGSVLDSNLIIESLSNNGIGFSIKRDSKFFTIQINK